MNRRKFGSLLFGSVPALFLAKSSVARSPTTMAGPGGKFTFSIPSRCGNDALDRALQSARQEQQQKVEQEQQVLDRTSARNTYACGHTTFFTVPVENWSEGIPVGYSWGSYRAEESPAIQVHTETVCPDCKKKGKKVWDMTTAAGARVYYNFSTTKGNDGGTHG